VVAGARFSLADCRLLPALLGCEATGRLADYPLLARYFESGLARPAFWRTLRAAYPEAVPQFQSPGSRLGSAGL